MSDGYPVTRLQEQIWLYSQTRSNARDRGDHWLVELEIRGSAETGAIVAALERVACAHPPLHRAYVLDRDRVVSVSAAAGASVPVCDLVGLCEAEVVGRLASLRRELQAPFSLEKGPAWRARLARLADRECRLLVAVHAIAFDAPSVGIFVHALAHALAEGVAPGARAPAILAASDALAHRDAKVLDDPQTRELVAAWVRELDGVSVPIELGVRRPLRWDVGVQCVANVGVPAELAPRLTTLGRDGSLGAPLAAAYAVLLARMGRREAIAFGYGVNRRERSEQDLAIGNYANTPIVRVEVSRKLSFRELVLQVEAALAQARARGHIPYDALADAFLATRGGQRKDLLQHVFAEEPRLPKAVFAGDAEIRVVSVQRAASNGTALVFRSGGSEIGTELDLVTSGFEGEEAGRLARRLALLLAAANQDPDVAVERLPVVTREERSQQLREARGTHRAYPARCAHELFRDRVRARPDATALASRCATMSYAELDRRSDRLAAFLAGRGVGPGSVCAIGLLPSLDQVVAVLGVLKAGAAFVALDPAYPADRLHAMVQDSRARMLLCYAPQSGQLPQVEDRVLLDEAWPSIEASGPPPRPELTLDHLAYVVFTSGSTGRPKGIMVSHRGIGNLAAAQGRDFGISEQSRVLMFASFSFDASVSEIFGTLCAGGTLYVPELDEKMPGPSLAKLVREAEISVVTLPPSALAITSADGLDALHTVVSAGEACSPDIVAAWAPGRRFVNAYGPSEVTVCATEGAVKPDGRPPSIGRPIDNTQVYVVDPSDEIVPPGAIGEIVVGGVGLAHGYLGRPALTAERFAPDPFSEGGARLYRTGDLGSYRDDGTLEFLGRTDHQVKLRGYRIEPGEVEEVLKAHPGVSDALVLVCERGLGDPALVAYAVASRASSVLNVGRKKESGFGGSAG